MSTKPARFVFLLLFIVFPLLMGCRNCEMLETALRMREQDMIALRQELTRLEFRNQALQHEVQKLHQHAYQTHTFQVPPGYGAPMIGVKRITLGRTTGGYDDDRIPGDEALQVIIEPRDSKDDLIKAHGAVQVTALEISPEGLKTPIGSWVLSPTQVSATWKRGLFSTGYQLILPWKQTPKHKRVRVIARFELSNGRQFETDTDVIINPPPMREQLPTPKQLQPVPQQLIQTSANGGNHTEQTSEWMAPDLSNAVRLRRPEKINLDDY